MGWRKRGTRVSSRYIYIRNSFQPICVQLCAMIGMRTRGTFYNGHSKVDVAHLYRHINVVGWGYFQRRASKIIHDFEMCRMYCHTPLWT